jgi:division protein CdvB (Snf7/Vps24/ESCRT-III family)
MKIIIILIFIGLTIYGAVGLANTLVTGGYNEIETIEIISAHSEDLLELDLDKQVTVVDVFIKLTNRISETITVDIHDLDGTLIGTGSLVVNNKDKFTVDLTDIVTEAERPDLRKITVTGT